MIRFLSFLLLSFTALQPLDSLAQEIEDKPATKYTLYIVRHGEKLPGNDPGLSEAGKKRAGELYRLLKDKNVSIIFSTPYKRTIMTGDSLRVYQKIDTILYKADATGDGFISSLSEKGVNNKTVLVIAHSNTIGTLLRRLGATDSSFKDLGDLEYNHIYKVIVDGPSVKMEKAHYGAPNPKAPAGATMQ